jgi:hypothetical protein
MTFSQSYAQARRKFLDAAAARGLPVESHVMEDRIGAQGEALATDTALIGRADAENLLIVTSGTHGVEGFCGSGCQGALIGDEELAGRLGPARTAMLLVHAVNPWGFSHLRRTNEDNIDLNRNCVDFAEPRPANAGYRDLDALLMPATWPPTAENEQAIAAYQQRHGLPAFQRAVSAGQYEIADGLFYGGTGPAWSQRTMRAILERHGAGRKRLGWIDIHTGLGPWGHGEKIFAGRPVAEELARARAWWGNDVFATFEPGSVSADVTGPVVGLGQQVCPQAEITGMGLEFGTLPMPEVLLALRADQWLHRNPQAPAGQAAAIKRALRDAFYGDTDGWKGMVTAQTRVAVLQAIIGLGRPG